MVAFFVPRSRVSTMTGKTLKTHMHTLEAMNNYFRASKDARARGTIQEILGLMTNDR